jgi:GGDEF domain-containing protein
LKIPITVSIGFSILESKDLKNIIFPFEREKIFKKALKKANLALNKAKKFGNKIEQF